MHGRKVHLQHLAPHQALREAEVLKDINLNFYPGAKIGVLGRVRVTREAVTIEGRTGATAGLLDQFSIFLRKFAGGGEPPALPGS